MYAHAPQTRIGIRADSATRDHIHSKHLHHTPRSHRRWCSSILWPSSRHSSQHLPQPGRVVANLPSLSGTHKSVRHEEENLKSVIPLASVALTQVPRCRPRTCVEADWRAHQHATQAIVCFIQGPPSGQQRRIGLMFCSSSSSQLKDSLPAQASFRFINPGRRAASAIGPRRRSSHTGESSVGAEASKHGRAPGHRATTVRPRVWSILTRWWAWRDAHLLSPDW